MRHRLSLTGFLLFSALFAPAIRAEVVTTETLPDRKYPRFHVGFDNRAYAYNGENGEWEATRVTLTYFEDLFQPYFRMVPTEHLSFTLGAGLLLPYSQEDRISRYWPFIQSRYEDEDISFELGSLTASHDFPAPIRDPLIDLVPRIRLNDTRQIPIPYETYPDGIHSHGCYEYGIDIRWKRFYGHGDVYMNWQLRDTTNHRERFDVGLIHSFDVIKDIPLYMGWHYWHNGGHENPHPVEVTENYTGALGLRNDTYSVLYLISLFLPNRANSSMNVFGQAAYAEYNFKWGTWTLTPNLFISDQYLGANNHQFISIEGDPFYRIPMYVGLNLFKTWSLWKGADLKLGFVNGAYVARKGGPWQARYDQTLRFNFRHTFDL